MPLVVTGGAAVAVLWFAAVAPLVAAEESESLAATRSRLAAIADARTGSIARWARREVEGLEVFASFPSVLDAVRESASTGAASGATTEHIGAVFQARVATRGSSTLALTAADGRIVCIRGSDSPALRAAVADAAVRAVAGGSFIDLGGAGSAGDRVRCGVPVVGGGVLVSMESPVGRLFALLDDGETGSVENLLFARDDTGVVSLSPVHRTGASGAAYVADAAVRGAYGGVPPRSASGEGPDLVGVPVLAEIRPVDGTPWWLVVQEDRATALAAFHDEMGKLAVAGGVIVLLSAAIALLAIRTARARHEEALARAAARFAAVFDDANDAIVFLDDDARILHASRHVAVMYGRPREEFVGLSVSALRAPEAQRSFEDTIAKLRECGSLVWETTHVRADGTQFPVEVSARRVEHDGRPGFVAVIRDVTTRSDALHAARTAELVARTRAEELAAILDVVPVAVLIAHDRDCSRVTANRMAMELVATSSGAEFDARVEDWRGGRGIPFLVDGRPVPPDDQPLRVAAREGRALSGFEFALETSEGTRVLFGNAAPLTDSDGEPRGAVAALSDVTEDRAARARIDVLTRAIEQCPVSIVVTDIDGRIEYVNPWFTRMTGYTIDEARGQNPRILRTEETAPETHADLWRTISSGRVWRGEFVNRRRDGTTFRESAVIAPVLDATGKITRYVAVKEDVTHRREVERDLAQARKMEAVGQLAGGVAHDFNNMLAIITGFTELVLADLPEDDARHRSLLEVLAAAERAEGLTRQLLAFSRKQDVRPRVLDPNARVRDVTKMLRRLIGEHIELRTELGEPVGTVLMDPGQFEQVLMNLCVNARDAMPSGGTIVIATADVDVSPGADGSPAAKVPAGRWVRVSVADTGTGIPEEIRERVFEPFFTTKGLGRGTGLGLPIVYGVVGRAGGVVRFDTATGRGTTFEVWLPRLPAGTPPEQPGYEAAPTTSRCATVLLVEDDPGVLRMTTAMLESLGHRVIAADGPDAALRLARDHEGGVDLLLSDVVMPHMNGVDLARALGPGFARGRLILMSGYTDDALGRTGHDLPDGALLLRKPFGAAELARRIEEALGPA